jgi:hypothetical protein
MSGIEKMQLNMTYALQIFGFKFAVAFVKVADIDAFHEQSNVVDGVG